MDGMSARQTTTLSVGLGFVAGYVDTVGFVALFGVFTAHVTGNFVLIGSALALSSGSVLLKLLVFPAFIAAVVCARLVVLKLQRRHRPALRTLLILQGGLLVGFLLLGLAASPVRSADEPLALWAGMVGAAAMGVQNAGARLVLGSLAPTTVMTGNVTQLVIDTLDLALGAKDSALRQRLWKSLWPIVSFGLGAIVGALVYVSAGFAALLLPIGVLLALAVRPVTV
jgi:uncharacterized membrane protein YoaK (UPF0700 family)